MSKFVSLLRVRDAILNLQRWRELVDSQGCKHLMVFLAAKRGGVGTDEYVEDTEANEFEFCDVALRVRPGKEPFYDPLEGNFRIETHPHSNIATARKGTFRDRWRAAEGRTENGVEQWRLTKNYVSILQDRMISKASKPTRIPAYDLCAWIYRSREFPTDATLSDVYAMFTKEYHLTPEERQVLFSDRPLDGGAEDEKAFFTSHRTTDSMLLEMLRDPMNYDLADAIAEAHSRDKLGPITDVDIVDLVLFGRRQLALQGPPGTGKTYLAKRAAARLLGVDSESEEFGKRFINTGGSVDDAVSACAKTGGWSLVQFHPSYTYEDFVRGIAPELSNGGMPSFVVQDRTFAKICVIAGRVAPKPVILIMDEVNRADLSKVLGELIYALEYRNEPVTLQYATLGEPPFSVPDNLCIIATLNSADRSIANIDYAIRRRFDFIRLRPDRSVVERKHEHSRVRDGALATFDAVCSLLENAPDLAVGHSYFLATEADSLARTIVFQVLPLLAEYRVEGILGDSDCLTLPKWPGSLPFTHERPFELVKSVALWLETYTNETESGEAQD